jgi:TorA-specific chaperone
MGRPAAMMKERLTAAGLWLEGRSSEPPDHLAVELEYLYLLLESGFENSDQALIDGAREFAMQEMAPWVRVWAGRLANETEDRFYPAAAKLVEAILLKIERF